MLENFHQLIAKFHKVGNHFNKISKNIMRFDAIKLKHVDAAPNKSVTLNMITMSVIKVCITVSEFLRMNKGLHLHAMDYEISAP